MSRLCRSLPDQGIHMIPFAMFKNILPVSGPSPTILAVLAGETCHEKINCAVVPD